MSQRRRKRERKLSPLPARIRQPMPDQLLRVVGHLAPSRRHPLHVGQAVGEGPHLARGAAGRWLAEGTVPRLGDSPGQFRRAIFACRCASRRSVMRVHRMGCIAAMLEPHSMKATAADAMQWLALGSSCWCGSRPASASSRHRIAAVAGAQDRLRTGRGTGAATGAVQDEIIGTGSGGIDGCRLRRRPPAQGAASSPVDPPRSIVPPPKPLSAMERFLRQTGGGPGGPRIICDIQTMKP